MWLADGSKVYLRSDTLRVALNPEMQSRVDELLGPGNLRLVAAPPKAGGRSQRIRKRSDAPRRDGTDMQGTWLPPFLNDSGQNSPVPQVPIGGVSASIYRLCLPVDNFAQLIAPCRPPN